MSEQQPKGKGGKRPGSGRKPTGAKLRSFRLTEEQYQQVKEFVKQLKAQKPDKP
jgi:hypothetical protein